MLPRTKRYGVSVLAPRPGALRRALRRPAGHRRSSRTFAWHHGLPLLDGALAHLVCRVVDIHPAGDHVLWIGEVEHLHHRDGAPLLFYTGRFGTLREVAERSESVAISSPVGRDPDEARRVASHARAALRKRQRGTFATGPDRTREAGLALACELEQGRDGPRLVETRSSSVAMPSAAARSAVRADRVAILLMRQGHVLRGEPRTSAGTAATRACSRGSAWRRTRAHSRSPSARRWGRLARTASRAALAVPARARCRLPRRQGDPGRGSATSTQLILRRAPDRPLVGQFCTKGQLTLFVQTGISLPAREPVPSHSSGEG